MMKVSFPRRAPAITALVLAVMLSGCAGPQEHELEVEVAPAEMAAWLDGKPGPLHPHYRTVLRQGPRNAVLNHMRTGLAAMELGADEQAARSFDDALLGIETVYALNEQAAEARSNFTKENAKDFKGEPYERAMAYYYRGLVYLREGDYENARASFRGGLIQDTMAADETFAQDFALLAFLDGWASQCNGDTSLAEDSFAEAVEYRPALTAPAPQHNLLVLAESGASPVKVAGGRHGEALAFERGGGAAFAVEARLPDREPDRAALAEDVYWQATTRGGREVDTVLAGKAQFKDTTGAVGDGLLVVGALAALSAGDPYNRNSGGALGVGLGLMAAGFVSKTLSAATTPAADIRYWDNLPERVHLATFAVDEPPERVLVAFRDFGGPASADIMAPVTTAAPCSIAWARNRSASDIPARAPNSSAGGGEASQQE